MPSAKAVTSNEAGLGDQFRPSRKAKFRKDLLTG